MKILKVVSIRVMERQENLFRKDNFKTVIYNCNYLNQMRKVIQHG